MKRAVLFRFHKNPEICSSRVELLKEMNPKTPVYGLGEDIQGLENLKDAGMEDLHVIENETSDWKWKNGDLAVKDWYSEKGRTREFDMLHIVEWDLLLTEPLEEIYSHIGKDELGLTGMKPISEAKAAEWTWINREYEQEWLNLKKWVKEKTGFSESSHGCIFPGACLPREFLEKFSKMDIPELCNDEVRVPLIAEALGYKLRRTGFYSEWGNDNIKNYFNAKGQKIQKRRIEEQLEDPEGRRAFHPVREKIGKEKIQKWKS